MKKLLLTVNAQKTLLGFPRGELSATEQEEVAYKVVGENNLIYERHYLEGGKLKIVARELNQAENSVFT